MISIEPSNNLDVLWTIYNMNKSGENCKFLLIIEKQLQCPLSLLLKKMVSLQYIVCSNNDQKCVLPVLIKSFENMVNVRSKICIYVSRMVCFASNNKRYFHFITDLFLLSTIKFRGRRKRRN